MWELSVFETLESRGAVRIKYLASRPNIVNVTSWSQLNESVFSVLVSYSVSRDWVSSDTECFREYNLAEEVILRDRVWSREIVLVNKL